MLDEGAQPSQESAGSYGFAVVQDAVWRRLDVIGEVPGQPAAVESRPLHPDTITARFNRLVDRAGVPHIRLHDVRHTYATLARDLGIDPRCSATGSGTRTPP